MKYINTQEINRFLFAIRPVGIIKLATISPNAGGIAVKAFTMPEQSAEATAWTMEKNSQRLNCYYELNPPLVKENRRSKEKDIREVQFVALDIDPDKLLGYAEAREHLLETVLPELKASSNAPNIIVDSGNGLQAIYRLDQPSTNFDKCKELSCRLAQQLNGDSTISAEHLFRVPGTLNYPNKTKLDRGYPEEPSKARIIELEGNTHTLEELDAALPELKHTPAIRHYGEPGDFNEDESPLTQEEIDRLKDKLEELLDQDDALWERWNGNTDGLKDTSRSGLDMSIGSLLKMQGLSYREMRYLVIEFKHGAGREKADAGDERYFRRLWANNLIKTLSEVIQELEGITQVDDMIPVIVDANLSHSVEAQVVDHVVNKGIPGITKRVVQNDLKAFREAQEKDEHKDAFIYAPNLLPKIVDQIDEKLSVLNPPVTYVRGNKLCQIEQHAPSTVNAVANDETYHQISFLNPTQAVDILTDTFDFVKKTARGFSPIACPQEVARTLLERAGRWKQKPLAAIIRTPTIRPNGTILSTHGHDAATGLYLIQSDICSINILERPTRSDAESALTTLLQPFKDFPFSDEVSKSVLLAAVLTVLIRPILRAAPLFLFGATKMGTGKSLLINTISMIADGRSSPGMMSYTDNDEEMRKRILAQLMTGANITCIDNVSISIESDTLCTVLTEPMFSDRFLGKSKNVSVPTTTTWLATGNAIRVSGDLSTRSLICDLDAKLERPEEREFDRNLYEWIPDHRGQLVEAALTILRAYQVQAETNPVEMPTWGRYEEWSEKVRAPLIWLGMPDPYKSNKSVQSYDPVREELGELLEAWYDLYGNTPTLGKDVIVDVETTPSNLIHVDIKKLLRLQDIVATVLPVLRARKLGGYLRKNKGRIENGYYVKEGPKVDNTVQWIVEKIQ